MHYEITVRPLSEEAKAAGNETFTQEVDAFVLGTVIDHGDEKVDTLVQALGPDIMWVAFIKLVEVLAKERPKEFSMVLPVALMHIMAGNGDKTMQNADVEGEAESGHTLH